MESPTAERLLDLETFAAQLDAPPEPPERSWRPEIVRLAPDEFERLADLCHDRNIHLIDAIDGQLMELAAVRLPAADDVECKRFADETLAIAGGRAACGNWVHLPWRRSVVHLLDRDAYVEVITSRNRDKITREEQALLRTNRIGVIGLSVGAEAAVTVAQEHLCGEIVLADFDGLDLSNLNRLGAGVHELGQNKAVITARRMAEIDPYLKVEIFEDGVTDASRADFLNGLDLLIEECDDLQMKYGIRRAARENELNVLFAGDERGFFSIEPYALWPDLRPFHGRIEKEQPPREAYPDALAFMQALTEWLGGWDRISERSRRSLEQIGETLRGYPQLAGEARYAAGLVAHAARRLLLGDRLPPYVGHLDLEERLPGP